jgi:hypothetical protein
LSHEDPILKNKSKTVWKITIDILNISFEGY